MKRGRVSMFALQSIDSGRPYSAAGMIDPTGQTPGTAYPTVPANPGYVLTQIKTGAYYFSSRGAFRTDTVFSTDLALAYEEAFGALHLLVKADVLNVFDMAAVVSPGTAVATRFSDGTGSGLSAFNPFTQTPVEGVHYRLSPDFGKATGPESYQRPRTLQVAVRLRF